MIVIAGRLSRLGFVFKPVSWLAGDSRLRQTFSLRIYLVERQSLSSIFPSTIISYLRSLEASLSTRASRSTTGPIVFSLDRNKPVTARLFPYSYEAGEYQRDAYDISAFTPGHLHPDNNPSPSYAQAASGSGLGSKDKKKSGKPPSPQQVGSGVAPPVSEGASLPPRCPMSIFCFPTVPRPSPRRSIHFGNLPLHSCPRST